MPNGTVVFGLRRCQALSLAFSDDEGDSWRLVDVPNSHLVPFVVGDLTYLFDGNTLVPEPISIDNDGNIFAIWVDVNYVLQMSVSRTNGSIWSSPVVIAAPNSGPNSLLYGPNLKTYLPVMRQHPTQVGRAALAYYASPDNGTTYNGLVAETGNLLAANPVFSSIQVNPISAPLQHNMDQQWDQGYGDPLYGKSRNGSTSKLCAGIHNEQISLNSPMSDTFQTTTKATSLQRLLAGCARRLVSLHKHTRRVVVLMDGIILPTPIVPGKGSSVLCIIKIYRLDPLTASLHAAGYVCSVW